MTDALDVALAVDPFIVLFTLVDFSGHESYTVFKYFLQLLYYWVNFYYVFHLYLSSMNRSLVCFFETTLLFSEVFTPRCSVSPILYSPATKLFNACHLWVLMCGARKRLKIATAQILKISICYLNFDSILLVQSGRAFILDWKGQVNTLEWMLLSWKQHLGLCRKHRQGFQK